MDSTLLRYWTEFYNSLVLAWILPFPVLAQTLFWYSPGFYRSPVLARILYPSLLHAWIQHFPILARTLFRYTHGFYPFPVLVWMLPFSGAHLDSTFLDTRTDSTILWYSPEFYHSLVLAQILPFFV